MAASEMPPAELTVTENLLRLAPARNGRPALVDAGSGRTITYSSLAATLRATAAGLGRRGVRPGDVVAVHVSGAVAFALASQAVRAAGGVPAPVAPGACAEQTAEHLTRCDARMLITDRRLACASLDLAERSRVRQVVSFGEVSGATRFEALLRAGTARPVPRTGDDPALLAAVRTADGALRPTPVTNREHSARLRQLATEVNLATWDVIVAAPVCGDGRGYSALLDLALAHGATVVDAPGAEEQVLLAAARTHRGTVAFVPPGTELAGRSVRVVTITP